MNALMERMESDFDALFLPVRRVVVGFPPCVMPEQPLPEGREDFTRDAETKGV